MRAILMSNTKNSPLIQDFLSQAGTLVLKNKPSDKDSDLVVDVEDLYRLKFNAFKYIDFIIADNFYFKDDPEAYAFLVTALVNQKKFYFLYEKSLMADRIIHDLGYQKLTKYFFKIQYYSANNLKDKVYEIVKEIKNNSIHSPEIKYTLRLSQQLYEVLTERAKQNKKTVSKCLRDILAQDLL